jgi:hypothetical protein
MRTILMLLLVGCGSDKAPGNGNPDAPGGGDGGIDAPGLTLDCASYCTGIMARCTGAVQQYESMESCVNVCGKFAAGTLGEMTGNTLGCRVYHTEAAAEDAAVHCEHAGPGGGTQCGASICDGFCAVAPTVCPQQWQNMCDSRCAALTSVPPYSINSTGDTIECRLYHLTVATVDPTLHCPHTDRGQSDTCN